MRKYATILLSACLFVSLALATGHGKELQNIISKQLAAGNKGDVDGYMATIDPTAPQYGQTKDALTQIFLAYKLNFKLESFKIVKESSNRAEVRITTLTTKVSGPAFRNNRSTSLNIFIHGKKGWLVTKTKMESIAYVD